MGLGRSELFFRLELAKKVIGITFLVAVSFCGVIFIAVSQIIAGIIFFYINSYYSSLIIKYGFFSQLKDNFLSLLCACLMAFFVYFMSIYIDVGGALARLVLMSAFGFVAYFLFSLFLNYKLLKGIYVRSSGGRGVDESH